jgi:hypothetical protein
VEIGETGNLAITTEQIYLALNLRHAAKPKHLKTTYEQNTLSADIATSPCHLCLCLYLVFASPQIRFGLLRVCCCNQLNQLNQRSTYQYEQKSA